MLAIGFTFLGGRYHATPWGRHVNEADIEWPPSAWRICRTLIATWHHKVDHAQFTFTQLDALIARLCDTRPVYSLPPAVHTHTRHYMPQYKNGDTKLVFDAFARVDKTKELIAAWEFEPSDSELEALAELLPKIGYLGRAESWVEARLITPTPAWETFTCQPGSEAIDTETGEIKGEIISLFTPVKDDDYRQWRDSFISKEEKIKKTLEKTVPDTLTAALSLDTADWQQVGWSRPPAGEPVHYLRPLDSLQPKGQSGKKPPRGKTCTTARFILLGKPLPRIEDAVRIGEWFRKGITGKARQLFGKDEIPPELCGHGVEKNGQHHHAFYLAEDSHQNGHIDHILVHAPMGFSLASQQALQRISSLWQAKGYQSDQDYQLVLEALGSAEHFSGVCTSLKTSTVWISTTPYLHPWHLKKKFTVEEQIRKECRLRKLPGLVRLERKETIQIKGRDRRPLHFHRFRGKSSLIQPDTRGSFWQLTFAVPVQGPIALGFGCHYGLGMFRPVD